MLNIKYLIKEISILIIIIILALAFYAFSFKYNHYLSLKKQEQVIKKNKEIEKFYDKKIKEFVDNGASLSDKEKKEIKEMVRESVNEVYNERKTKYKSWKENLGISGIPGSSFIEFSYSCFIHNFGRFIKSFSFAFDFDDTRAYGESLESYYTHPQKFEYKKKDPFKVLQKSFILLAIIAYPIRFIFIGISRIIKR